MSRHAALLAEARTLIARRLYAPAERSLKKALKGNADDYALYEVLAFSRHAQADVEAALNYLKKAAEADPKQPGAPFNRGVMLSQLKRPTEAADMFARVIALEPQNAAAWQGRGDALAAGGDWSGALAAYEGALACEPKNLSALMGKGAMLGRLQRHEEALAAFDAALALSPQNAAAHYNRGRALSALYKYAEAFAAYERAIKLKPDHVDAWINRGTALEGLGRRDEARDSYRKAEAVAFKTKFDPRHAAFNLSTMLLAEGDFERGFALYPNRSITLAPSDMRAAPGKPIWRGEQLDGVLRVWPEQGVGDEILFAGLIPLLAARAPRVVWECAPRLVDLIRRSFPELDDVRPSDAPCEEFKAQISAADLGAALHLKSPADLPNPPRFWRADEARVSELRARYEEKAEGRKIIGIAWRSKAPDGALRGPDLSHWRALLREEYFFVSLQYGDVRRDIEASEASIFADEEINQLRDMEGFFAQVAAMDHVVSILNTTLHVAGALGKPALALVPPGRGLHWYWGFEGEACAWNPSVRLLRRALDASWEEQIENAALILRDELNA